MGRAVAKAVDYRMGRSADFMAMLSLMLVLDEGFDREQPHLREILANPVLDPREKIAMVLDELLVDADP